ncbi:MAG: hypothetical protein H6587_03250 [Flavobacteriales bacterium]|nr:hypothetical protein [Flavobacteriales bacterium]MCB9363565.1 hypothetical protein [Flavobacteriales bacterium]
MRNVLLIITLFLFACNAENTTIANCEKWEVSKSVFYDVVQTEIKTEKDSIILAKKSNYRIELIVNEIGDSNQITCSIKFATRKPDSLLTDVEKLLSDTIEYKEEFNFIYQTNKIGQYQEIINWNELDKKINKSWDDYKDSLINSAQKEEAIANLESAFLNRTAIETKLTMAITPLHSIYGLSYSNQTEDTQEIMTGLSNQALPSIMSKKILAEENNYILMQLTHVFDSNQLLTQVNEFVGELGNKETITHIEMTDTCNVGFNKLTGWPYGVEFWRIAKAGNMQKKITLSITEIEN